MLNVNWNATISKSVDISTNSYSTSYLIVIHFAASLAILFNFLVVISSGFILLKGLQPRSTYMLLGNIALADLIFAIAMIWKLYPHPYNRTYYLCASQIGLTITCSIASMYSVALMAMDRCLYITLCMHYDYLLNPQRVRIFIVLFWCFGAAISFLPMVYHLNPPGTPCWFLYRTPTFLIIITMWVELFPLIIVLIVYVIILYVAIQSVRSIKKMTLQIDHQPSKWKAIKVVTGTSASFLITGSIYSILVLIYAYTNNEKVRAQLLEIIPVQLGTMKLVNAIFNPLIYAWWNKNFRQFLLRQYNLFKAEL